MRKVFIRCYVSLCFGIIAHDDQWNGPSAKGSRPRPILNGYFHLPAFSSQQVVDQIDSYRITLYQSTRFIPNPYS
jgi:hypothetical protein